MWNRISRRATVLVGLACLCLVTSACGDFERKLPNGYTLVSIHSGNVSLYYPAERKVVIHPSVDEYAVSGDLVVGHVSPIEGARAGENAVTAGYFIVNTRTHEVQDGLPKEEWLKLLGLQGVKSDLDLRKPGW